MAVFAAGHRTMYKTDLRKFDVLFRKLLRSVVGPPAGMDWTRPWHEILHDWNGRVNEFVALHGIKLWSERCVQEYWELAHYISSLEDQRWVKRLMQWQPDGRGRGGRPACLWHTFLTLGTGGKKPPTLDGNAAWFPSFCESIAEIRWDPTLFSRADISRAVHNM